MSFAVSTPDGPVEIVQKIGDVTHGSLLLDAEGNVYVPQKQGYGAVPLEVAEAVAEQEQETLTEEELAAFAAEALAANGSINPADDGAPEGDVDSGEEETSG